MLAIIIPQQANMKLLSFGLDFEMPNTVIWSASPCGVYTVKQPVSGYFRNLLFIILVPKVGLGSGIFTFLRIYNTCFGSIIIAFSLIAFFGKHIISLDFFFVTGEMRKKKLGSIPCEIVLLLATQIWKILNFDKFSNFFTLDGATWY